MTARIALCAVVIATALAGCGGDSDESPKPPTDPDTVGLPSYVRESVACLREAGIKVRVPIAMRKLLRTQKSKGQEAFGAQAGFLTFLSYDRTQKLTPTQLQAARTCTDQAR
jgi:hypothetical protein